MAVLTALSIAGTALSPYLAVEHPLLLIALSPDNRHVVLVAGDVNAAPLIVLAVVRRVLGLSATYGLGFVYGHRFVTWTKERFPRWAGFVRLFERIFERAGAPALLVLPTYTMSGLAGASRTPPWTFLVAVTVGQLALVSALAYFGDAIAAWTGLIVAFLADNLLEATGIVVAFVALQQLIGWRRRRSAASPLGLG